MKTLIACVVFFVLWYSALAYYFCVSRKPTTYKVALYSGQLIEGASYHGGDDLREFTIGGKRVLIPRESIALIVQE